jgi:hypothetical protein
MNAKPADSRGDGVPLGAGSPDEPAHTLPAEPRQITKAQAPKAAASQPGSRTRKRPGNEEPELTLEEDLPSDGKDEKGEAMIRSLPRQTEKKEKKEK